MLRDRLFLLCIFMCSVKTFTNPIPDAVMESKWFRYGCGTTLGGLVEFVQNDDSHLCINELATVGNAAYMAFYFYNNRDPLASNLDY